MSRDTVSCRSCGATLGTLNRRSGGKHGGIRQSPVLTKAPGVIVLQWLKPIRIELYCPHCDRCGRTFNDGDLAGILHPAESNPIVS